VPTWLKEQISWFRRQKRVTPKTKAIAVLHYAWVVCDMDIIMDIAGKYNIYVVEDAAHTIESFYKGRPLGGIGHLGTFSFRETKNIQYGEGGLLIINDKRFIKRAEIVWEKGTNRATFFRGEIDKYGWVDTGSLFLLLLSSHRYVAAFLYGQLEYSWRKFVDRIITLTNYNCNET
jgi:dTDP-4-amino-4,6-dideoxygalactose transaminase